MLNKGKPFVGKKVGDPAALATNATGNGAVTRRLPQPHPEGMACTSA